MFGTYCCKGWTPDGEVIIINNADADLYWRVTFKNKDGQTKLIKVKTDVPIFSDNHSKNYSNWIEFENEVESFFHDNDVSKFLRIVHNIASFARPENDSIEDFYIAEVDFTVKCHAEIRCKACNQCIDLSWEYEFEGTGRIYDIPSNEDNSQ